MIRRASTGTLRIRWLGRVSYAEAWDLQRALGEGRALERSQDDYLLLLEHPHTYTVGRNGDGSNLRIDDARLADLGAELHHVDRGGDITYHGPGQLVGYPIVAVPPVGDGFDVIGHVRRIERMLIETLGTLGVQAWEETGYTGVWTNRGKVAAIGVKVSRGVSTHGFALNVQPDLSYFGHIVPCGISDRPVTSVGEILGRDISLQEVVEALIPLVPVAFSVPRVETQLGAFARGSGRREFDVDRLLATGTFSLHAGNEAPIAIRGVLPGEPERPDWMRVKANLQSDGYRKLKRTMRNLELNTVCEEAGCPNIYECWEQGTATLMLLGDTCTRACGFCNVATGKPGGVATHAPVRAAAPGAKAPETRTARGSGSRNRPWPGSIG